MRAASGSSWVATTRRCCLRRPSGTRTPWSSARPRTPGPACWRTRRPASWPAATTFDATLDFARESRFFTAAFNHLLPFPGTRLYRRLEHEGRLLSPHWWLDDDYHYGQLAYRPVHLEPAEVSALCRAARTEFARPRVLLDRGIAAWRRGRPQMWPVYWAMNVRLGREVDEKYDVPIGRHLDEFPK